ncbi:mannose-1-phosphate guanylyltransferase/mannose-6-phosphate isomerase [Acidaminobacter sp.]|uniref:mannose-1-phosphate guanylyltransferase/mannose-6-phosphate isomerase n=1 Tax=Acidaminobacter sp. TaxID=1872102 RepID=UPI00137DFBC0|nr:mannose-1-phosphate guanylyltransferase/mannose-6-phosphate isomerase [Acidaminobacter sp.]MDK9710957.1 mannose-1-phosphate guanylyltransferase/mannose-6-phosphate isomerase [Acidaminobacter sp.]MZQ98207.1 mannose-1-phosphate guanylyltransferase/mannose-6-phosphate isomerase [Acidaminobacter sp.]
MKIIILAGGCGARLWPLSRTHYPKQFIKFHGKSKSLFQDTFERSLMLASPDDIYVVTNESYKFLVMGAVEELGVKFSEEQILVEPVPKNTLPAIYAGVQEIIKIEHEIVVVFPSDHIISDGNSFAALIKASIPLARDSIITFGITPDHPHTGYGYIAPGEQRENGFLVKTFKEKPDLETAKAYIDDGYYWNAGIFMFHTKLFIEEVKRYVPEIHLAFAEGGSLKDCFSRIQNPISMDYGIMEKSSRISVVPAAIGWNDLGSFDAFYDVFEKDSSGNISNQKTISVNATDNLIYSEPGKLVAAVGVDDLIIIDNRDALLICKKDQSQNVKDVVEILKLQDDPRTEYHIEDYRPWGHYKILEEEKDSFKIKRITVHQGKKLSYQLHHHRSEHWVVVRGMARVTIDDEVKFVCAGESIFMKPGQRHRLENPGKIPLEIIEVQMGEYLEEDDIVRFDDEYGRK